MMSANDKFPALKTGFPIAGWQGRGNDGHGGRMVVVSGIGVKKKEKRRVN